MNNLTPKIYFYIPSSELINGVPDTIEKYWVWIDGFTRTSPAQIANRDELCTWVGPYNWTVQTFIYLRANGFPCELTASLPDEGIIIAHGDFLPFSQRASAKQFIVEIKPDRTLQCLFANFVIVQNRRDPIRHGIERLLINSAFVNYWPQPGLIPRDPRRGDRFENICYMGNPEQFLSEVDSLETEVKNLGLRWKMVSLENWHDYNEVDAVVAVRPLNSATSKHEDMGFFSPNRKPASKLINAWLAGVPAILSPESAFEDIKKSEMDYLEAKSIPEIIEKLKRLISEPLLRKNMMEKGNDRAREFSVENRVQVWTEIIQKQIVPAYAKWTQSSFRRGWLFFTRFLFFTDIQKKKGFIRSLLKESVVQFSRIKFLLNGVFRKGKGWKIGFLTEEFEHRDLMPFGGYGMTLKFVTDYFNNGDGSFKADVLMCERKDISEVTVKRYHSADLVFLPHQDSPSLQKACSHLIFQRGVNVFIGIDHYRSYEYYLKNFPYIPWVVWIKDPKDRKVWEKVSTIDLEIRAWGVSNVEELINKGEKEAESLRQMIKISRTYGRKIYFAAEANHLGEIARRQYGLEDINPFHWPKPIPLPSIERPSFSEKPSFLFLARLDPIKRPWIYFELAKKFKDADFYVAGKTHQPSLMDPVIARYKDIPNLKFMGRIDGDDKAALLDRVWAVVNTSIHEGVPVSLLEGFSYGKPAIAALDPDQTTSRFGIYVGEILGDGDNSETVDKFSAAIEKMINGEFDKERYGQQARQYIADVHSFFYFESSLKRVLSSADSHFEYKMHQK